MKKRHRKPTNALNYVPKGARLDMVVGHCRAHGRITTRDAVALTGYPIGQAGNILTRLCRDDFLERVKPGVYKLADKGDAWNGPIGEQVVAMCNEAPTTAQYVAWKMNTTLETAQTWLKWLCDRGRIARIGYGIYGGAHKGVQHAAE